MSDYTFPVKVDDQTLIFKFVMHEEKSDLPVKLGDGTFGSVFCVEGPEHIQYAFKIFYETEDKTALARYQEEMNSARKVRATLKDQGMQALEANIVLPVARSQDFKSSTAFKNLKNYFENIARLSVSDYALAMPLYMCTLKDLLERGAPANRVIRGRKIKEPGKPGYHILQGTSYHDRERMILPFIHKIASGLLALHTAKFHHHDLKPANVLVKGEGTELRIAVADLGFLNPNINNNTMFTRYGESLPLGTRHYRSPEQKDYFDICEVKVSSAKETDDIELFTYDLKFQDTIIEEGDIVIFSKDPRKTTYYIKRIIHIKDTGESKQTEIGSKIILKSQNETVEADSRTQIILYKQHTIKTDIFGLGALIFDLLTAGRRSPEQFYDMIRPWDQHTEDADLIETHISKYERLTKSQTTYPELATIFKPFRHDIQGYPSVNIIRILLRCMISAPSDSYVSLSKDSQDETLQPSIFQRILDDIKGVIDENKKVIEAYRPSDWTGERNPIWFGDGTGALTPPRFESDFLRHLEKIQGLKLDHKNQIGKRLILAYHLIRKIVESVQRSRYNAFLANFSPNYLQGVGRNDTLRSLGIIFPNEENYWESIETNDRYSLPNDPRDKFSPPILAFNSRPVSIFDAGGENSNSYIIQYQDSCPFWSELAIDDVIVVEPKKIGIISWVDKDTNKIQIRGKDDELPLLDKEFRGFIQSGKWDGVVIKRLNPINYYLSMIGIYIHQLFFVDGKQDAGEIPQAIWLFRQTYACGMINTLTDKEMPEPKIPNSGTDKLNILFDYLARLYAWLVCLDYRQSPAYSTVENVNAQSYFFAQVNKSIEQLREIIANIFDIDPNMLDTMGEIVITDEDNPVPTEQESESDVTTENHSISKDDSALGKENEGNYIDKDNTVLSKPSDAIDSSNSDYKVGTPRKSANKNEWLLEDCALPSKSLNDYLLNLLNEKLNGLTPISSKDFLTRVREIFVSIE